MSIIDKVSEKFLWCRDVMHAWDPYTASVKRSKISRRNEMHQVLLCTRCGTLKTRVMTTGGDLLRHSYSYPDGYLLKEQGRMTPADRATIRRFNVRKAVSSTTEDEDNSGDGGNET